MLPGLERMAAQCLGALSSLDRQKMLQHASRDTIRHEGGKMRSELVQLRCRPTMRWPADTRLGAATASAAKPRQPHGHPAEQRRDLTKPPVLDVASTAAGRAIRPQNRMIAGLHGNDRLLNARQKLLCLRQRQPQIRDIAKVVGPADLQHLEHSVPGCRSPFRPTAEPTSSTIPQPATTRPVISLPSLFPQFLDTPDLGREPVPVVGDGMGFHPPASPNFHPGATRR